MSDTPSVLIVGAGPTGLMLALWLRRLGIDVRIIDKDPDAAPYSRALGVHARTLEFYRMLGFAEEVLDQGVVMRAINLWVRRERKARLPVEEIGEGLTPYPFILDFAQDQHERLLIAKLEQEGVRVERSSELVSFREEADGVRATLRRDGRGETITTRYIAGCDGAHSVVRQQAGIGFAGGTYDRMFYVADVEATGPVANGELHVDLSEADLLAVFAMKGTGHIRLVGTVLDRDVDRANFTFDDVNRDSIAKLQLQIAKVNWFSTYRVHHRVASAFRRGRAFLLGDAAHIHSPVGAQGMNTGLGDAVNLAWKLAAVLRGADPSLLDTYETERIAFARRLVATTDRAFSIATRQSRTATLVRIRLFPLFVAAAFRTIWFRRFLFRTVSQIEIEYRESALSAGRAGSIHGGDRLPWVPMGDADNFVPLRSLDWQLHVYGDVGPDIERACATIDLPIYRFQWSQAADARGLERDAAYLIRPDGYVAIAGALSDQISRHLTLYRGASRPEFQQRRE